MRKLILNIACSLDGYIAGKRGEIDWLLHDLDKGLEEFKKHVDLIVMGRKTFNAMKGAWDFGKLRGHVFSRSLQNKSYDHVTWVSDDLKGHLQRLKKQEGKDIWLLGGGEIVAAALSHNLLDEIILSIHPILLGKGIPLFPAGFSEAQLKLQKSESFASGLVQMTYKT